MGLGVRKSPFRVAKPKVTIAVMLIQSRVSVCVLLAVSAELIFFEHPERSGFMLTRGKGDEQHSLC